MPAILSCSALPRTEFSLSPWSWIFLLGSQGRVVARERGYLGYRLRECLDTLAVTFGYARNMERKKEQQGIEC